MNEDALPRGLFFLAGAASGLALGFYLHSEKGSALRQKLSEHWGDILEGWGEHAQERLEELLSILNTTLEKGLDLAEILDGQLQQNRSEIGRDATEAMETAGVSFENGMEKARARLEEKFKVAGLPPANANR